MAGTLPQLIVHGANAGADREVEIVHVPFALGRQSDNDLVLLDSRISRHHARIVQDERGYVLEDCESRHGTFVNNERVEAHVLKSGDRISLGVAEACQLSYVAGPAALPNLLEKIGKATESPAPQLQHLGLLLQMAQMLHRAPALEEVLTLLVDSALQLTDAERGLLFLLEPNGELRLSLARGRGGTYLSSDVQDYSHEAIKHVMTSGREEVTLEDQMTGRSTHDTAMISGGVRGVVVVPLQKHAMTEVTGETIMQTAPELLGILYMDSSSRPTALTGLDRQVLQTFALEGATVIENARLFRITREQEKIQHEFSLARRIQQDLLPRRLPHGGFFEVHAITMPCQTVGGDYFDVIRLPKERYGLTVADVSGKGLPAAMLAATLQGAFTAVATGDPPLEELFRRVNEFLCERTSPEMFATIFYGVLGPAGQLDYVNAGQATPLVVRAGGEVEALESPNFPLGLFADAAFEVRRAQLLEGDQILVFSDGVTEAQNLGNELFGEERVRNALGACAGRAAQDVCAQVVAAVQHFVGSAPQADDLTLTVLRFQTA